MQHLSSNPSYNRSKNNLISKAVPHLQNGFNGLVPWLFPIFLITLWQLAVQFGWLSTRILPAPTTVISAAIKLGAACP